MELVCETPDGMIVAFSGMFMGCCSLESMFSLVSDTFIVTPGMLVPSKIDSIGVSFRGEI